jgi:ParB family chromosome partitioning protein
MLTDALGLHVAIRHSGESGELRIRYGTLEQLDGLCRKLTE